MRSLRSYILAATLFQLVALPSGPAWGAELDVPSDLGGLDAATEAIWGLELPSWALGFELSDVGLRSWELVSPRGDDFSPEADVGSLTGNAPLSFASRAPLSSRLGHPKREAATTHDVGRGDGSTSNFAWQPGGGLGYALAEWATLTAGYRYHAAGSVATELGLSPAAAFRELERSAHEFFTSLRVDFHAASLDNLSPARWSLPHVGLPGWLVRGR